LYESVEATVCTSQHSAAIRNKCSGAHQGEIVCGERASYHQ
jgi:hypothetical protein